MGLRQTAERRAAVGVLLDYPGLSVGALAEALRARGLPASRRTLHRLIEHVRSSSGCLARWRVIGPVWVCWGCGRAVASARDDPPADALATQGLVPLDFGGYCATCQQHLAGQRDGDVPPGLRRGRSASTFTNRRATAIPVGAIYQNATLMRDLLGSSRRIAQRDYVVANLAENPRSGPTTVHQFLNDEVPIVPALRSVKRLSSQLHGPKAQILFASLGAIAWTCLACAAWGTIADPAIVHRWAPTGFAPTDVRVLCAGCRGDDTPV